MLSRQGRAVLHAAKAAWAVVAGVDPTWSARRPLATGHGRAPTGLVSLGSCKEVVMTR